MRRSSLGLLAIALLSASLTGCGPLGQKPPINETPAVDALEDPAHPGLEACASGHASAEVEQSLEIARGFRSSCHELIVCGGIASNFGSALVTVLLSSALGGGGTELTYLGDGSYQMGAASGVGTTMKLQVHLHRDTSFGVKGSVVPYDLTRVDSYLLGAKVAASASIDTTGETSYSLTIDYEGQGPAFELLELPEGSSGIEISADAVAKALGKLELAATADVHDVQAHAEFVYTLGGPPAPIGELVDGGSMSWSLQSIAGGRADIGQTLTLSNWDMRYSSHGVLDGTIGFSVTGGGAFDYGVIFEYPMRAEPDVSLSCGSSAGS